MTAPYRHPVTDLALAQRLERAEGSSNAAFVEARALQQPEGLAGWRDVSGTMAMFDGVGSPATQTFGLGLFAPVDISQLDTIELFFAERLSDTFHEVCPLGDAKALTLLPDRGYRPIEQSSVLWQPLVAAATASNDADGPVVRRIRPDEVTRWVDVSAEGWGATAELAEFIRSFGTVTGSARGTSCFVAELDGRIISTAALNIHHGVALLAGASTVPEFRRRGAQSVLLRTRLAFALESGCDVAMMAALPGSTSQLNAERQGFRIAYTRTKWQRALEAPGNSRQTG